MNRRRGCTLTDIEKLLGVLQRLVDLGNTVVVIEHNLDVIKCADWIIDMGPGAGVDGGNIVFAGTPEDLAKSKASLTAPFLAEAIQAANRLAIVDDPGKPARPATIDSEPVNGKPVSVAPIDDQPISGQAIAAEPADPVLDPWKVLGRKWHSLGKGFPGNGKPQWPLEIADAMLGLLEQVAGDNSLDFTTASSVRVAPQGSDRPWAEVETKTAESLKVTLAGPPEAIDLDGLPKMRIDGPIALGDYTIITLNVTDPSHVRSRKLRTFLTNHLERSR
jgi:excinuclease ABC subunit A